MRVIFGVMSLLLVLAVVAVLARSNLGEMRRERSLEVGNRAGSPGVPSAGQAEAKIRSALKDAADAEQRQRDALEKP